MIDVISQDVLDVLRTAEIPAELSYAPTIELPDAEQRQVIVTPAALEGEPSTRTEDREDHTMHVGVIARVGKRCAADAVAEQLRFVRSVRDLFKRTNLERLPESRAVLQRFANAPIYFPEHLRERGLFVSTLALTFRVWR